MGVLYTMVIATVLPCVALIEGFGSFANPIYNYRILAMSHIDWKH